MKKGDQKPRAGDHFWVQGGSREAALYSRKAHYTAQNPKIVAEHEKGKVLAQTKERVHEEKVRDEKVL